MTGLPADGNPVNLSLSFSDDVNCSLTVNNFFTALNTCLPVCEISNIQIGANQTACNQSSNTYDQELIITYANAPTTGTLDVNGLSFAITESPQTVTLVGSSALVFNTFDVTFLAACITLDPGFEVQLGAEFLADPIPCVNFDSNDELQALHSNPSLKVTPYSNKGHILLYDVFTPTKVKLSLQKLDGTLVQNITPEIHQIKGHHSLNISTGHLTMVRERIKRI